MIKALGGSLDFALNFIKSDQNTCFIISFEGHIWHPDVYPGGVGPYFKALWRPPEGVIP